jgi:hypothetical protein
MKENLELNQKIQKVIEKLHPQPAEISFVVIDLNKPTPEIAGVNMDHFIYPASIYKVFIGAEILRKVNAGFLKLEDKIKIEDLNAVDTNIKLFPKDNRGSYAPLLHSGDEVTINYLLELMFSRSDNTAANTLLDIADREDVNRNIILPNGWVGSDITRKFVDRLKEQPKYQKSSVTVSTARHLAELFFKIEKNELINPWVSEKLKEYMTNWNRGGREGLNLPEFTHYYRKGGWLEINGYKYNFFSAIKNVIKKGHAVNRWSNDAGVITAKDAHYVVALLTLTKSKWPWVTFPLKKFSREIYEIMRKKNI